MDLKKDIRLLILSIFICKLRGATGEEDYGSCQTANGLLGDCKLLQSCTELYNIAMKSDLEDHEIMLLRNSRCGSIGKSILVCCPKPAATPTNDLSNSDCETPDGREGKCISIRECGSLLPLIKDNLSTNEQNFITRSVCGQNGYRVCCPDPAPSNRGDLPSPSKCGKIRLTERIFGGTATDIDEFPWTVLLIYYKGAQNEVGFHCGGSLINDRYVLTAGHCVSKRVLPASWRLSGVRLGEWNLETQTDCQIDSQGNSLCSDQYVDAAIEEEICHPLYNVRSQENDIALLRLQEKVNFNSFILPICLPLNADTLQSNFENVTMEISGWGATETASSSKMKLKALVRGQNIEKCKVKYRTYTRIELGNKQMCAGGEKSIDTCRGDSGGPLMLTQLNNGKDAYYLAGVVSFGPTPCGQEGFPGVYTRVDSFVNWIQNTIKK
ncbi:unnamed protein product [Ceratitis capitata]|uniref:CLIP domain-containing serine protease n=1 Tax=Ceratitis capitata TaxID=7213 RepID=A0A811UF83_CERCA|nr:unnamed protein product [Ceratitis capitata]